MKNTTFNNTGFTLMETILYVALLSIFLTGTFLFVNSILSTSSNIIERNEVVANREFIDSKLHWLLSQATGVSAPVLGSTGGSLTITGATAGMYPAVITLSNNQLLLSLAGGATAPITNSRVQITSFAVSHINTSDTLHELRITTDMRSKAKTNVTSLGDIFTYVLP
ncbi:MAG: hypothetical protein RL641_375 [Candidatus Parcubacteria bacterium]|jgi:hypothetical protein